MNILVHRAGSAAVLRAAKPPRLEESGGELANTGLMVKFTARADGTALHVFAGQFAREARVFSL